MRYSSIPGTVPVHMNATRLGHVFLAMLKVVRPVALLLLATFSVVQANAADSSTKVRHTIISDYLPVIR